MTLRTVNSGGGADHTTISAAEAVVVYGDEIRITGGGPYDEEVTWSGATGTPSVSNDILVNALTEHLGVFGAGVLHQNTSGSNHCNTVSQDWMHFRGYSVIMDQTGASDECFRITSGVDAFLAERMIIRATARTSDQDGVYAGNYDVGQNTPNGVVNCIFKGFGRAGLHPQNYTRADNTQDWFAHFCTFDECGNTGENESGGLCNAAGTTGSGGTPVNNVEVYNCLSARTLSTFDDFSEAGNGTLNWTGSHLAASDTSPTNIGLTTGAVESSDITTELTDPDTDDYSLAVGSDYEAAGTDRTGSSPDSRCDLTVDIAKVTRPATPSIGAFEAVAAGGDTTLAVDGASYAYAAGTAGLAAERQLAATGASYAYAAGDAGLAVSRQVAADGATYGYSAGTAGLVHAAAIAADGATYAYSAGDAGLAAGRGLVAAGATFAYNAGAAGVLHAAVVVAAGASYGYAAGDAGLIAARKIAAAGATYGYSAGDAGLTADRKLAVVGATYAYAAGDATLTASGADATLVVDGASYAYAAGSAGLAAGRKLSAEGAAYAYSAGDAGLIASRQQVAAGATYAYAAGDAGLIAGPKVSAAGATYAYSAGNAGLASGRQLTAAGATYAYAAGDAAFDVTRGMLAEGASYGYAAGNATLFTGDAPVGGAVVLQEPMLANIARMMRV